MKLKKFMKKEVTLLGKTMPAFVLLILVGSATTGMAALVGYLSNTVTSGVTVKSAFALNVVKDAIEPTSSTDAGMSGLDDEVSISFTDVFAGNTVVFSGYIENRAGITVPVYDRESFAYAEGNMATIEEQFDFFGTRYWRPEGSVARLTDYVGEPELGWDPYWDGTDCHDGLDDTKPLGGTVCTGTYCAVVDNKCYFTANAFSYVDETGDLVSNYPYTYTDEFTEELMQTRMTFAVNTQPGTYTYSRVINIQ